MVEKPFFEFIEEFKGIIEIRGINDLKFVKNQLEEFTLFESAGKIELWKDYFNSQIEAEFNEECEYLPINCDLDGEWLHEWELPQYGENL